MYSLSMLIAAYYAISIFGETPDSNMLNTVSTYVERVIPEDELNVQTNREKLLLNTKGGSIDPWEIVGKILYIFVVAENAGTPAKAFTPKSNANPSKGVSPSVNKPPRAPSGFRTPYKPVKKQGLYGGATGRGGSGSGSGSPGDDSNPNNPHFNTKSSDLCQNPNYFNQAQKKKKKKKKSRQVSKKRVRQAYQDFMSKMKKKGYERNVSEDRFLELSTNPQSDHYDEKSIFETKGGLELEAKGVVNNLRRPDNPKVDLDFVAERVGSGETIFIDHKRMIDFEILSDKGIDISGFPSHESVAFNMGKDSVKQKERFIGMDKGPASRGEVVHLYNFENIRNRAETSLLMQAVLNGAEQVGYMDGIIFLNYE